jgi:hypothetical protein
MTDLHPEQFHTAGRPFLAGVCNNRPIHPSGVSVAEYTRPSHILHMWTERADNSDAKNLRFARKVMDEARSRGGGIVCRTPNAFPLADGFRVFPVTDIE